MTNLLANKLFSIDFKIDAKVLTIIYICYEYKFPLAFMITFYELYGETSMFALKALTCAKKAKLTDTKLMKIVEESRLLYTQILAGISTIMKIKQLKAYNPKDEPIPEYPTIDTSKFTAEYKEFVENYLLQNIRDIYAPVVNLRLSSHDLYREIMP